MDGKDRLQENQYIVWVLCLCIIAATFYVDLRIPLRSGLCHTLYPGGFIRIFPATRLAMPGIALVCSILTIMGIFYSPQPLVFPLESSDKSWISALCDVGYCHPIVSSQGVYHQT